MTANWDDDDDGERARHPTQWTIHTHFEKAAQQRRRRQWWWRVAESGERVRVGLCRLILSFVGKESEPEPAKEWNYEMANGTLLLCDCEGI